MENLSNHDNCGIGLQPDVASIEEIYHLTLMATFSLAARLEGPDAS